jgi:hypothetical protein
MPTGKRSDDLPRYYHPARAPRERDSSYKWPLRRSRTLAALGVLLLYLLYRLLRPSASDYAPDGTRWNQYAYSLYATDSAAMCHAVLVFDALKKFGSKADRVLFYPEYWDLEVYNARDRDSQLLVMARDDYKVKLQPVKLLSVEALKAAGTPTRPSLPPSPQFPHLTPRRRPENNLGQLRHKIPRLRPNPIQARPTHRHRHNPPPTPRRALPPPPHPHRPPAGLLDTLEALAPN